MLTDLLFMIVHNIYFTLQHSLNRALTTKFVLISIYVFPPCSIVSPAIRQGSLNSGQWDLAEKMCVHNFPLIGVKCLPACLQPVTCAKGKAQAFGTVIAEKCASQ